MKDMVVILDQTQLVKIENPEELTEQMKNLSSGKDIGSAVMDPRTGDVYIVDDTNKP